MLNGIWLTMLLGAVICGAVTGRLEAVARASTDSAGAAVSLAVGLVGVMTFWLGLMRVLQEAGLLGAIARRLRPVLVRLFSDVPADHPALGMMVLNMTANVMGLGNAATPFGLKAMQQLDTLNRRRGSATDAMVLFLAINTSGLAVLPTGMVALRASLGSKAPGSIFATTLLSTLAAAIAGAVAAKVLAPLRMFRAPPPAAGEGAAAADAAGGDPAATDPELAAALATVSTAPPVASAGRRAWAAAWAIAVLAALVYALWGEATAVVDGQPRGLGAALHVAAGSWPLVLLIAGFVLYGYGRGVAVYDAVVQGGREGFTTALRIIPYLTAILVAVGMLRASGAIDLAVTALEPLTELIGMPAAALPMALLRPLTGSGAYAIAADIMRAHGPDTLVGEVVSTIMGSTETTFYVLALYLGAVGIRHARHAVACCLVADVAGTLAAVWSCRLLLH